MTTLRIIVPMPEELVRRIDAAAAREQRSRANMIRRACSEYVDTAEHMQAWAEGRETHVGELVTKTGKALDDAEINRLADEAERGYDVTDLKTKKHPPHEFASQGINALRCRVCGQRKAAH
jgi:predicted transcriptional regulator